MQHCVRLQCCCCGIVCNASPVPQFSLNLPTAHLQRCACTTASTAASCLSHTLQGETLSDLDIVCIRVQEDGQ
jgi:hypothetical protein